MKTPVNFRDIGGIKGHEGKIIKEDRIFRGGQLFELTDTEKKEFCDYHGIKSIFDLRNEESFSIEPNGEIEDVEEYIFQVMMDMEELSKDNPMRNSNAEAAEKYLTAVYGEFVTNNHANSCFKDILEKLAYQNNGSIYFHCFAGKDRTGVVAAIILSALGASREDIMTDYMKTAEGRKTANEMLIAEARESGKSEEELEAQAIFLNVKPQYLDNFLDTAENKYGSFEEYIISGIGVEKNVIEKLRENYLR